MTDLQFTITSQNFLHRTDSNPIKNQVEDEYICHFLFENEEWEDIEKFVTFSIKKQTYTAILGTGLECSSPIPYEILKNCLITIKVHGEDLITRNQVSLVVIQPQDTVVYQCQTQDNYQDVYTEMRHDIDTKFDNVQLEGDKLIFYANDNKLLELSLADIEDKQSNWEEADETSTQYIQNKPDIINNFRYENDNLICLSDNVVKQEVSLKHNHIVADVTDFDDEIDIDLNNLLISITENIRSL